MKILGLILVVTLTTLGGCQPTDDNTDASPAGSAPNVILLMADDMGWAQTSYYGHPILKTPNLDDMAANGLRMDRFYAGAPSCTPTRASVLTGRTNDRTGAFRVGQPINKQEKMLSTAFQDAGYATAHFGKWHLNYSGVGLKHPLEADDPHNPGELGFSFWLSHTSGFDFFESSGGTFELSRMGQRETFRGDGSEVIVSEALDFISDRVQQDKPVFVVIWYSSPHGPWKATAEDIAPFLGQVDRTSANMHGEIVAMDRSIGALRQGLRDLGIADNTLIWFTSDNGGSADIDTGVTYPDGKDKPPVIEYPSDCSDSVDPNLTSEESVALGCIRGAKPDSTGHLRGFKKDFYEGGLRVPSLVEWPVTIKPRVTNFPSATYDIFPTLIDVANLDPESINTVYDGMSIVDVFHSDPPRRDKPLGFRASDGRMWMDNDWKLVQNVSFTTQGFITGPLELFNIIGDPSEEQDLINAYPARALRMQRELEEWSVSVSRSALGADYPEGYVLPTGRKFDPVADGKRERRFAQWAEEIRRAESK